MPVEVPLWLACLLRKQRMCSVVAPAWLRSAALTEKRDEEVAHEDAFSAMPAYYEEVAALLLDAAPDDLEADASESALGLREAVADIAAQRAAKIRAGTLAFAKQSFHDQITFSVKMNNVAALEVTAIRDQLLASLDAFYAARPLDVSTARAKRKANTPAAAAAETSVRTLKRFEE